MPRLIQLRCCGHSRGAGSDDSHRFSRPFRWTARPDDAFLESTIDDCDFDIFDRDGISIDSQHAGTFARRGAQTARKLGEVVGRQKT